MPKVSFLLSSMVAIAICPAIIAPALAEVDPWSYYEFRVNSALPGMMFAVTPQGQVDFAGALQQNIPVAFTPCSGSFVVNVDVGSNSGRFPTSFTDRSGSSVNSTTFLGVGFLRPGHGLYGAIEATSTKGEGAESLQYQLITSSEGALSVAIGAMDILNERDRTTADSPGEAPSTTRGPFT